MPRRKPEDDFMATVIDEARLNGWHVWHFHTSMRLINDGGRKRLVGDSMAKGFPDLVLARPPKLILAELKSATGRLSDDQKIAKQILEQCTEVEYHLWKPKNQTEIGDILTRNPRQKSLTI